MVDYGLNFRNARLKKRMSQTEAANALDITGSFISQIENNKKRPSVDLIFKASKLFGVDVSYFYKSKEEVEIERISSQKNKDFINDLERFTTNDLKEKYDMTLNGEALTDDDLRAMIAYLKILKETK